VLPAELDSGPGAEPDGVEESDETPPVITVPVIGTGRLRVDDALEGASVPLGEATALFGSSVPVEDGVGDGAAGVDV